MNIKVDLEDFFNDHRKNSLLYINLEEKIFISEVIEYICEIFDIDQDRKDSFSLFVDGIYIPAKQSSLVLKDVKDVLKLKRGFSANECDTTDISEKIDMQYVRKKKHKIKKLQDTSQIQSSPDNKFTYEEVPFNYNNLNENFQNVKENRKTNDSVAKQISNGDLHTAEHKNRHKKLRISLKNDSLNLTDLVSKGICTNLLESVSENYSDKEILSQSEESSQLNNSKDCISKYKSSKKKIKRDKEKKLIDIEAGVLEQKDHHIAVLLGAEGDVLEKVNNKGKSRHSSKLVSNYGNKESKENLPLLDSCNIVMEKNNVNEVNASVDFEPTNIDQLKSDLDISLSLPLIKKKRKRKHSKKKHQQLDYNQCSESKFSKTAFVNPKLYTNDEMEEERKHIKFGSDIEDNFQSLQNIDDACQTIQSSQNSVCQKEVNNPSQDGEIYYRVKSSKGPPTPAPYEKSINTELFAHLLILEKSKKVSVFKRKVQKDDIYQEQPLSPSNNKLLPQYTPCGPPSPKDLGNKTGSDVPQSLQRYKELSESKYTPTYFRTKDCDKPKVNNGLCLEEESLLGLPISFSSSKFKIENKPISHSNLPKVDKWMEEKSRLLSTNQKKDESVGNDPENDEGDDKTVISFMGIRPKKVKEKKMYSSIGNVIQSLKLFKQNGLPTGLQQVMNSPTANDNVRSVTESSLQSNASDNIEDNYSDLVVESEASQNNSKPDSSVVINNLKLENFPMDSSVVSDMEKPSSMDEFYLTCPLISELPNVGDTIVAKVMTIDKTFCPCFSDYQPAKVVSKAGLTLSLQYLDQSEITPEKIGKDMMPSTDNNLPIKKVDWRDLKDIRIIFPASLTH